MLDGLPHREVWLTDFEYMAGPGTRPDPVCLVACELRSGRTLRLWRDQFGPVPPYAIDPDALFVSYYSSAEIGCHLALGWQKPARILDLFTEFRCITNGLNVPAGNSLLGALAAFGLDGIGAAEKDEMRALILRGRPWTNEEREAIISYCENDVMALARLLLAMLPHIDLGRALLRGRYMAAAAQMEHNGIPIDVSTLHQLQQSWTDIQDQLIADIDRDYHVFDGRTFKADRFAIWLVHAGIPWPRLESGRLDLSDDAFRQMAKTWPIIAPLRELRSSLADLRLSDLAVGPDGRNRCLLSAFRARTSRNQPSNAKFVFGPSVWLRGLIKPPADHGICYADFCQQEFAIAAALSNDGNMQTAYLSGDPYLAFARQAGASRERREQFKQCALAVQYGMGPDALAARIGQPPIAGRELLRLHREAFPKFWRWSDAAIDQALLVGKLHTVFGWQLWTNANANPRSLRNFPMQANGAEMLRLACCLATERGIEVCAPIHDALLICAPLERLDHDIAATRAAMAEASRIVLAGFELRTDVHIVRHPDRYQDKRGAVMWSRVMKLIGNLQTEKEMVA
jgi:DNA polymerase-1